MSQVRKQSIVSTIFVYGGFLIGFFSTYLFTRQGSVFTPSEYGLTNIFMAVGNIMFAFANLGTLAVGYKFYPYYNDNLPKKKNDLLTLTLLISILGFCCVILAGIVFKDLVIKNSAVILRNSLNIISGFFPLGFPCLFSPC